MYRKSAKTKGASREIASLVILLSALVLTESAVDAVAKGADDLPSAQADPVVDIELLTWPEIYKAIHEQGKTTAIIFDGGTEQRGPQGVTGAHNFIGHGTAEAIARKLGNALVAPVIPYSVNKANPNLPGTIGITGP